MEAHPCHSFPAVPAQPPLAAGGGRPQAPLLNHNAVVAVAAMACALICALGLNSMLQCIIRCTQRAVTGPATWAAARRLHAGIRSEDVVKLPITIYSATPPAGGGTASPEAVRCPICLSDLTSGDKIRLLPACGHRFHVGCIDTWLISHSSCPTCRHWLRSSSAAQPTQPPPPPTPTPENV
ncbi:RING-H2 finger protein ATL72 [Apostasia shenzhenica]|uniref:RING-H2 finger protein ATL72 n=1 Tax=Apostasia shenzhenica TaxID=1088818 RepID=A0A2I0B8G4_9ASPA|nr:RING-H2 finger protein ATL72 [Apostasia shenzhenica]